jgi:hypothetical protein
LNNAALRCKGEAAEGGISIDCNAKYSPRPGYNTFVEARLDSWRDGDT